MTGPIVERVLRSSRYRDVDPALVERLAAEEVTRARTPDDAVKRVKRRLHQAVGAYRGASDPDRVLAPILARWRGDLADVGFRDACREVLGRHASTAERVPYLDEFYAGIWRLAGGPPASVVDLGAGLGPLALPWMGIPPEAAYHAVDVDRRSLAIVDGFLRLVGQSGSVREQDLVADPNVTPDADVALLLKLVPLLDRQDGSAATRLLAALRARYAVVSFPMRSLGGRRRGYEATYRRTVDALVADFAGRVVGEASVPNELVVVMALDG